MPFAAQKSLSRCMKPDDVEIRYLPSQNLSMAAPKIEVAIKTKRLSRVELDIKLTSSA